MTYKSNDSLKTHTPVHIIIMRVYIGEGYKYMYTLLATDE